MSNYLTFKQIIDLLESGSNCIAYGNNNSGKTTLLKKINEYYIEKNTKSLFLKEESGLSYVVTIPAKRVFELQDGGILANQQSLSIDVVNNFGKEWNDGSYILGVREKIKQSQMKNKVASMCSKILDITGVDVFDTKCSDGVQNVVNMLSYIFHVLNLYTGSDDISILLHAKFLLIVDEIELFLYTKSIVNLLEQLFSAFENIQMLISSHSILVMQRINNFRVLKIEGVDRYVDSNLSPYYQDFGVILASFYDVKEYPDDLESFINSLDCLLRSDKKSKSELKPVFEEACRLRMKYPIFAELITNLQLNFFKRFSKQCCL